MPTSFDTIRASHARQAASVDRTVDPPAAQRSNIAAVKGHFAAPRAQPEALGSESPVREEIRRDADVLRDRNDQRADAFDRKSEATHDGDGTLSTTRSLLKDSTQQLAADAQATADNAAEVAQRLLNRR